MKMDFPSTERVNSRFENVVFLFSCVESMALVHDMANENALREQAASRRKFSRLMLQHNNLPTRLITVFKVHENFILFISAHLLMAESWIKWKSYKVQKREPRAEIWAQTNDAISVLDSYVMKQKMKWNITLLEIKSNPFSIESSSRCCAIKQTEYGNDTFHRGIQCCWNELLHCDTVCNHLIVE